MCRKKQEGLKRNKTCLARNKTKGGNLLLSGTVALVKRCDQFSIFTKHTEVRVMLDRTSQQALGQRYRYIHRL